MHCTPCRGYCRCNFPQVDLTPKRTGKQFIGLVLECKSVSTHQFIRFEDKSTARACMVPTLGMAHAVSRVEGLNTFSHMSIDFLLLVLCTRA